MQALSWIDDRTSDGRSSFCELAILDSLRKNPLHTAGDKGGDINENAG